MSKAKTMDEFDALLYLAAQNAGKVDLDEFNALDTEVVFSARFERRMKWIIREFSRDNRILSPVMTWCKRVAVVILAVMASAFALSMSVEAVREALISTIVKFFDTYMSVEYLIEQEEAEDIWVDEGESSNVTSSLTVKEKITEYKIPVLLEEQFEKVYDYRDNTQLTIDYEQGNILIIYNQYLTHNYINQITYENAVTCEVSIAGHDGIIVEQMMETQFVRTLIWNDGEYAYTLSGNVSEETLVSAAESVQ